MISEIEKGEAAMYSVERDPAAEPDLFSDVVDGEFAAKSRWLDPIKRFLVRKRGLWGLN